MLNTPVLKLAAEALVPYSSTLAGQLTYKDRYEELINLWRQPPGMEGFMYVPRGLVDKETALEDYRTTHFMGAIPALVPPRGPDQAQCLAQSIALLNSGRDHITQAPTGWGKTYHGCATAAALGEATLIIVTKNDLIEGWHKTLKKFFGLADKDIGHVQQDKCTYEGRRFVVAMVHSLICREYEPEFYRHFGLVIFDEVHRLGADYFQQVCKIFPAKHRLGLSATVKRKDGRFRTFESHIGPMLVEGKWVPMSPKILIKRSPWKPPEYLKMQPGQLGAVVKRMGSDPMRNLEIAEFVKAAYDKGRNILVLSDLIDGHLKKLFHAIAKVGVPGHDIDFYIGGRKQHELDIAKKARVVLATYAFTSEGTDVPEWDTLVMATPKAAVKQSMGRVLRFMEGKKQPVILDLVDNHALFEGYHKSRLKEYFQVGGELVTME